MRVLREGRQAFDVSGTEGPRLQEVIRPASGLVELPAEGQIAGQQAEAEGDLIGMQTIADQVIEIVAV